MAVAALGASARAQAAVAWCGTDEVASNRVPDLEVSSPDQIRVVYAVPSDVSDSFSTYASAIATDVAAIDAWWQGQDPTRSPRWDLYPFPGCGSRFGQLDIGVLRLPQDSAFYAPDDSSRLDADVTAALAPASTAKTLVYYDGALRNPRICGQSRVLPERGGPLGTAYVFLRSSCGIHVGDGGSGAMTAAHELIHDLGALVEPGPPHACPGDSGHPCDSPADILNPFLSSSATLGSTVLDVGHDDYYGHSGDWFDVQDSAWLMHLPQFSLQVAVHGSGRLTTDLATDCPQACTVTLDNGLAVQLDPVAAPGWRFAGWQGDCGSDVTCALTMDGAKSVVAVFTLAPQLVRVSVTGPGRVTSVPGGIACPARCVRAFASGTVVRLVAKPAAGRRFAGWSGACTGRGSCSVRADQLRTVRAAFRR